MSSEMFNEVVVVLWLSHICFQGRGLQRVAAKETEKARKGERRKPQILPFNSTHTDINNHSSNHKISHKIRIEKTNPPFPSIFSPPKTPPSYQQLPQSLLAPSLPLRHPHDFTLIETLHKQTARFSSFCGWWLVAVENDRSVPLALLLLLLLYHLFVLVLRKIQVFVVVGGDDDGGDVEWKEQWYRELFLMLLLLLLREVVKKEELLLGRRGSRRRWRRG